MSKNLFGIELFHSSPKPKKRRHIFGRPRQGPRRHWSAPESPLDKVDPFTVRPRTSESKTLRVVS